MKWRIAGNMGEIDPSDVPDLNIGVYASTLTQTSTEDEFPMWSNFIPLTEVTHGKPGGAIHHF